MTDKFFTAIQLRNDDAISSYISYGVVKDKIKNNKGYAAIVEGCSTVFYVIRHNRKVSGYLFLTGAGGSYSVPGVYPSISLYGHVSGSKKVARVSKLIGFYLRNKDKITDEDSFFTRSMVLVNQLKFEHHDIHKLYDRCKENFPLS